MLTHFPPGIDEHLDAPLATGMGVVELAGRLALREGFCTIFAGSADGCKDGPNRGARAACRGQPPTPV